MSVEKFQKERPQATKGRKTNCHCFCDYADRVDGELNSKNKIYEIIRRSSFAV